MVKDSKKTVKKGSTKKGGSKSKKNISNKRKKRNIVSGVVHIQATFNNTIITITDLQGNAIAWSSAGKKFKGSRKSTPFAAQMITAEAIEKAREYGLQSVRIAVKGPGMGRDSALRVVRESGLNIVNITDTTHHPHNGCRAKRKRRV